MMLLQPFHRIVSRGIVGNYHRCIFLRVSYDIGEILLQHLPSIPIEYDDRYLHYTLLYIIEARSAVLS